MMVEEIVLAGGVRTPFGRFGGALKDTAAIELAELVVGEALARAGVPEGRVPRAPSASTTSAAASGLPELPTDRSVDILPASTSERGVLKLWQSESNGLVRSPQSF